MMTRRTFALILLLAAGFAGLLAQASGFPPLLGRPDPPPAPFPDGEVLTYEVHWKPLFLIPALKAGEIKIQVSEAGEPGNERLKIRAWADSDGALTRIAGIEVRNYFESEIDARDFRSYRSLQQTREGKRHRDLELHFDYAGNRTMVRETDPLQNPPKVIRDQTKPGIPAPAVDVLSVFYVTRLYEYSPGDGFHFHLNNRGDFELIRVVAQRHERVRTPLGRFPCLVLATQGGLFRGGGDFRIWLTRDRMRVPVRFEADVRWGKVYGDLVRQESPLLQRSIIRVQ